MVGQSGTGLEIPIYKEIGWDRVGKGGIDGMGWDRVRSTNLSGERVG
jgi:hypothetical protein